MGEVVHMKSKSTRHVPGEPRRVRPSAGQLLTLAAVRSDWRPSCSVAALNVFSIVWSTPAGDCWAPLHDFAMADQQRALSACRRHDELNDPERLPSPPRRFTE
jgi:hypothetical protein